MVKKENKLIKDIEDMDLFKLHPTYFGGYSFFMIVFGALLYAAFSNLASVKGFVLLSAAIIAFALASFMIAMNNERLK